MMQPGAEITLTVTYLEMTEPPSYDWPSLPPGPPASLIGAEDPPAWYFLALYGAVGAPYEWTDWLERPEEEARAFIQHPEVTLYTLMRSGWPAGFFILDSREAGRCDLAYFGLVPEMVGQGLGSWMVRTAIHMGWDRPGTRRMTVETCSLDHPRALSLYQRAGFAPIGQKRKTRVLTRPRPQQTES